MTEDVEDRRYVVTVILAGQDSAIPIRMPNRDACVECVAFAAMQFLRKSPADRAFAWVIFRGGTTMLLGPDGVGEKPTLTPMAVFDPREVVGVCWNSYKPEDWKGTEDLE